MAQTNILYIEDNPENRLLVRRTLEASGYVLAEAVDGPSGLRAAQESRPDLILLDISLPEMDGYALARRFASFDHLREVPVLAVTANVMKGDKERALGAGCDGYIPKPIDIDQLPRQVEEALQAALRRRGDLELGPSPPSGVADGAEGTDEGEREAVEGDQGWPMKPARDEPAPGSRFHEAARPPSSDRLRHDTEDGTHTLGAVFGEGTGVEPASAMPPVEGLTDLEPDSRGVVEPVKPGIKSFRHAARLVAEVAHQQTARSDDSGDLGVTRIREPSVELSKAGEESVIQEMEGLAEELGATMVFLARSAQVMAKVGGADGCIPEELAALAARGFRASHSAACLLGCDGRCREQITDSGTVLLHTVAVDDDLVLVAAMSASIPLGAARLWVRRAARRVGLIVTKER